jgi:HK97 family phage major capsid protein
MSGTLTLDRARSDEDLRGKLRQVEDDLSGLQQDRTEAQKKLDDAKAAFAATEGYDPKSDEFKAAEDARGEVGEIDDKIAEARMAQVAILKMLGQKDPEVAARRNGDRPGGGEHRWDSSAVVASEEVRNVLELASKSEKHHVGSVMLGQVADREATVRMFAADVTGTANMREASYAGVIPQLRRPLRVLDLINIGTIDGNSLPYTQEGGTFLAAETAEGDLKPEDGVTYTDATAAVETIAAWQKVRKQSLADYAALQSMIDGRLRYSVLRRVEAQILNGNGTSPNLRGILQTAGIGSTAFDAGAELADLILNGITKVLLSDAEATGIIMHPTDWESTLKAKAAGDGHYFSPGPFSVTPQVLWGTPLVPSPAIPQGHALVGDFAIGASYLVREGVNVLMSDSDGDDFRRNRVTLLGETRGALPVWRPAAFVDVDLSAS